MVHKTVTNFILNEVKNVFSCFININESTIIPLNNTVKYDSLFKY